VLWNLYSFHVLALLIPTLVHPVQEQPGENGSSQSTLQYDGGLLSQVMLFKGSLYHMHQLALRHLAVFANVLQPFHHLPQLCWLVVPRANHTLVMNLPW
jgi:hypothetical protein